MYRYAIRLKDELLLSDFELFESRTLTIMWSGAALIGLISVILAMLLPRSLVPFSGFAYSLLGPWFPLFSGTSRKNESPHLIPNMGDSLSISRE